MGGVSLTGVCKTYAPRNGVSICLHSKAKFDRLCATTGSAFYVKPINGVRSGLAASSNTHARYGAVDIEGDGYTSGEVYTAARRAREAGWMAYPRLWKNPDGSSNWHIHMADPDCPNMHKALYAQFLLFGRGYNALVGNGPDPLGGYKKAEIMDALNGIVKAVTGVAQTVVKAGSFNYSDVRMNMGIGIDESQLKPGARNNKHVARLQSAIWNWRGIKFRQAMVRAGMVKTRGALYDGDYGPVTAYMVSDSYKLLDKLEPRNGWLTQRQRDGRDPLPTDPGPKFLKRIGFKVVY